MRERLVELRADAIGLRQRAKHSGNSAAVVYWGLLVFALDALLASGEV
jgi:hypothetical protein